MRKRIMIVHNSSTLAPIIGEALNNGTFDLRFVFGLSNVIEAVQKQKPALLLFDISSWQKAHGEAVFRVDGVEECAIRQENYPIRQRWAGRYGNRPRLWR